MRVWPGNPYPLGATWDGKGVNFALFSEHATRWNCAYLTRSMLRRKCTVFPLPEFTDQVWHAYCPRSCPANSMAIASMVPMSPQQGQRFNPNKVLLDPYAKSIGRDVRWADELFGYRVGDPEADLSFDERDSAAYAPWGWSSIRPLPGGMTAHRAPHGTRPSSMSCM